MTCQSSANFVLYCLEQETYIECTLETNHQNGTREGKYRSCPTVTVLVQAITQCVIETNAYVCGFATVTEDVKCSRIRTCCFVP